MYFKIITNP